MDLENMNDYPSNSKSNWLEENKGTIIIMFGLCMMLVVMTGVLIFYLYPNSDAEMQKIKQMNCKQLGNFIIIDKPFNIENMEYAKTSYLVNCK